MTLLAIVGVLLHRHGGHDDIIVGTAVANRPRAELEPLIRPFLNTLALRLDLSGDPSFCDLLARVRRMTLDAYAHQDLPYERLVDEVRLSRDLARDPLVPIMLTFHNTPHEVATRHAFKTTHVDTATSKTDLAWFAAEANGGLAGWVEYRTDLFERSTIKGLLSSLELIVASIAPNPHARTSRLRLLSEAERGAVVTGRHRRSLRGTDGRHSRVRPRHASARAATRRARERAGRHQRRSVAIRYGDSLVGPHASTVGHS